MDRLGIMGWSFGGGTAAEACRLEDRLKAAVLLDGYLGSMQNLFKSGLVKPFLAMNSPSSGLASDNTTLFNKSPKDAYQLSIKDASHEAFTDNAWIVNPSAATRRRAQAMNACLVSFFNKHLKGNG
jgi:dienelactone hydrolase